MSETQDSDQVEQDQIAQFERAHELRVAFRLLRAHRPQDVNEMKYRELIAR
jgi:hypothetical protein